MRNGPEFGRVFPPVFVVSQITQVATPSSLHLTFPPTTLLSLCERSYEKSRFCGQPLQLTVAAALAKVASHRSDAQQERAPPAAAAGFPLAGSSPSVAPLRRRREPARSLDVAERLRARYTHVALGRVDEEGRERVRRAAEVRVRVVAGDGGRVFRVGGGVAPLAALLQSRVTAEVQPKSSAGAGHSLGDISATSLPRSSSVSGSDGSLIAPSGSRKGARNTCARRRGRQAAPPTGGEAAGRKEAPRRTAEHLGYLSTLSRTAAPSSSGDAFSRPPSASPPAESATAAVRAGRE